tara:strand:- start:805 stop:1344 length:540 start_codon:yes stop_codon:yes gene_type:complete
MSLVKNSVWCKRDSLGNVLSEEKVLYVDIIKNMVTLKSMPLNPINIDDFKSNHKFIKVVNEDHSGLSDLLGGFSHLRTKPKKVIQGSESVNKEESSKIVEAEKGDDICQQPKVEIDPKIKSVLDLTRDSLLDGDVQPSLKLLQMFQIDIEEFVNGLVSYQPTQEIIGKMLTQYLKGFNN